MDCSRNQEGEVTCEWSFWVTQEAGQTFHHLKQTTLSLRSLDQFFCVLPVVMFFSLLDYWKPSLEPSWAQSKHWLQRIARPEAGDLKRHTSYKSQKAYLAARAGKMNHRVSTTSNRGEGEIYHSFNRPDVSAGQPDVFKNHGGNEAYMAWYRLKSMHLLK